jgi:hypothetical protein
VSFSTATLRFLLSASQYNDYELICDRLGDKAQLDLTILGEASCLIFLRAAALVLTEWREGDFIEDGSLRVGVLDLLVSL